MLAIICRREVGREGGRLVGKEGEGEVSMPCYKPYDLKF